MEISRRGAGADHGVSRIKFTPKAAWSDKHVLQVLGKNVTDFSTNSRHNYTINIDLQELAQILAALAAPPTDEATVAVREAIAPVMPSLVALLMIGSGR